MVFLINAHHTHDNMLKLVDPEQRGGCHHQTPLTAQTEEVALQAVLHARGRVQLAVDGIHPTCSRCARGQRKLRVS